jgi:hypothetical protein
MPIFPGTQRLRQEDLWSPGVWGQPGQHNKTLSLKYKEGNKIKARNRMRLLLFFSYSSDSFFVFFSSAGDWNRAPHTLLLSCIPRHHRALYVAGAHVIVVSCWRPWMERKRKRKAASVWLNPFKNGYFFSIMVKEIACSNGLKKSRSFSQEWWCTPIIPVLRRQRQEDWVFQANLGHYSKTLFQNKTK